MKRYILVFLLLAAVFVYANIHFASRGARVFRVGTECDYPPNNWEEDILTDTNVPIENKNGFYAEGYDIQIAKLVAKSLGLKLEVRKISWMDLIQALNKHEIDAIFSGMLDTNERKKILDFSDVYDIQTSECAVMVRRNGKYADARNLKDFIGASFVSLKDSNFDRAITQVKGAIHLPPVTKINEIFDKLRTKEADATVLDLDSARTYERVYPGFVMVRFPEGEGIKFDFTGICAAVRKDDTQLLEQINNALKDIPKRERQRIMDQCVSKSWDTY